MAEQPDFQVVTADQPPTCMHHWVLGEPSHNAVSGRCKRCGATKVFPGSPEGTERFDDYRELTQGTSYYVDRRSA